MFDKKWTQVIFLTGNNWDGVSNQTEDIQIDWSLNSPCYKLRGDAASDNRKKVDTPFEYKETPLDADGITVYYDATLSKLSYEDNKKGIPNPDSTVYYYATNGTKSTEGKMTKEKKEITMYIKSLFQKDMGKYDLQQIRYLMRMMQVMVKQLSYWIFLHLQF